MAPLMYYHVIPKEGTWHLYFGNSASPVFVNPDRRKVLEMARKLARQNGMKVVIHRPADEPSKEA